MERRRVGMNEDLGVFALTQLLASSVIIGPILMVIGFFSRQQRRRSTIYLSIGAILTIIGAYCLYRSLSPHNMSGDPRVKQESRG